jgi:hypothetical protein
MFGRLERVIEAYPKIWLGAAFFTVALLSFEAGVLHRSLQAPAPLVIAGSPDAPPPTLPQPVVPPPSPAPARATPPTESCAYVGSRQSNKYHLLTSRCAKQIKATNIVCFASVEAAAARGYLPGCLE